MRRPRTMAFALLVLLAAVLYWRLGSGVEVGKDERSGLLTQSQERLSRSSPSPNGSTSGSASPLTFDYETASAKTRAVSSDVQIRLTAVDAATGKPVEGAMVLLFSRTGEEREEESGSAHTDHRGRALFDPPPGRYRVELRHPEYIPAADSFDFEPPLPAWRTVQMVSAIRLEGAVLDPSGQPVWQAALGFSAPGRADVETASGGDGSFQVWLPAGTYQVTARKSPFSETVMHGLEVWPGRHFALTVILEGPEPERLLQVSGVVQAEKGPVAEAVVSASQAGPWESASRSRSGDEVIQIGSYRSAITDSQGRFSIDLPPEGFAWFQIRAPGHELWRKRVDLRGQQAFRFRLQSERRFLAWAVDSQGRPLPEARIVGVNSRGRPVVRRENRFYAASEYPFEIFAVDEQSGQPLTGRKPITAYQPQIVLQVGR